MNEPKKRERQKKMDTAKVVSIRLYARHKQILDEKLAEGEYATKSEIIRDLLEKGV